MFVDKVKIFAKSGNGGEGAVSFRREKYVPYGGPDGGNGGKGGDILLKGNSTLNSLDYFYYHPHLLGNNGEKGCGKNLYGKGGEDKIFSVPIGTSIYDEEMNLVLEINDDQTYVLSKGGKGGIGNYNLKTHKNPAPEYKIPAEKTELKTLYAFLTLKMDVGLIGLPNSGKSSLINSLSNANSVVGDYSFTTLNPVLGILHNTTISLIDLPGIIENAHQGKGRGLEFLRHSEHCKMYLQVIDASHQPLKDFYQIRKELHQYKQELFDKDYMVILNKIDKITDDDLKVLKKQKEFKNAIFISCIKNKNINLLRNVLMNYFNK